MEGSLPLTPGPGGINADGLRDGDLIRGLALWVFLFLLIWSLSTMPRLVLNFCLQGILLPSLHSALSKGAHLQTQDRFFLTMFDWEPPKKTEC